MSFSTLFNLCPQPGSII